MDDGFRYVKRTGALSGYLVVRMPAIMEKHSTHKIISVTGPNFGTLRGWWQHLGLSSSVGCQASGTSSAMSMNFKSRIFFTSFGGSDVDKPWLAEAVGEALVLVIGVVEVEDGPGLVRVVDGTVSRELLVEAGAHGKNWDVGQGCQWNAEWKACLEEYQRMKLV